MSYLVGQRVKATRPFPEGILPGDLGTVIKKVTDEIIADALGESSGQLISGWSVRFDKQKHDSAEFIVRSFDIKPAE